MPGCRLSGCVGVLISLSPALSAAQSVGSDCTRLREPIPAESIGLPSAGVTIDSADVIPRSPLTRAELPFGPLPSYLAVVPAAPEYCKVTGFIAPVDSKAPPIRFQVNLPTEWNGSSVQFGGGGFNGVLITGLGLPPLAPPDRPSPLARGFVTYGTDSGHQKRARRSSAGLCTQQRGADELRLCILQEGARRGGGADAAPLWPRTC